MWHYAWSLRIIFTRPWWDRFHADFATANLLDVLGGPGRIVETIMYQYHSERSMSQIYLLEQREANPKTLCWNKTRTWMTRLYKISSTSKYHTTWRFIPQAWTVPKVGFSRNQQPLHCPTRGPHWEAVEGPGQVIPTNIFPKRTNKRNYIHKFL